MPNDTIELSTLARETLRLFNKIGFKEPMISLIEFADWVRKCAHDGMAQGVGPLDAVLVLQRIAEELLAQELMKRSRHETAKDMGEN